jgi:hypothetical protein
MGLDVVLALVLGLLEPVLSIVSGVLGGALPI